MSIFVSIELKHLYFSIIVRLPEFYESTKKEDPQGTHPSYSYALED